jgi:hypothetical protein
MKSKSAYEWFEAFGSILQELNSRGLKPKLQTMDNEASSALKTYFTEHDMTYQLVPPHCHRCNASERTIRTFKEHFVTGFSSVDTDLPMHIWDCLLPQAEMTLNLLRTSILLPQLSAAAHFHGLIGYNKIAFAPTGCKIIAHECHHKSELGHPMANLDTCHSMANTGMTYFLIDVVVYITTV